MITTASFDENWWRGIELRINEVNRSEFQLDSDSALASGDTANMERLGWLTPREQLEFAQLRSSVRRQQWQAGRWCAKQLLSGRTSGDRFAEWEVLTRDEIGKGTRPLASFIGKPDPRDLTLSHDRDWVIAATCPKTQGTIGVDLVSSSPTSQGFSELWFDLDERRRCQAMGWANTVGWAMKEASYKASNRGEPFHPRQFVISWSDGKQAAVQYRREHVETTVTCQLVSLKRVAFVIARCCDSDRKSQ